MPLIPTFYYAIPIALIETDIRYGEITNLQRIATIYLVRANNSIGRIFSRLIISRLQTYYSRHRQLRPVV